MKNAVNYCRSIMNEEPQTAIVLGSGLSALAEEIEAPVFVDYSDIPGMELSTAPGHIGRLVFGRIGSKSVVCMQGRLHFYEGHSMDAVVFPIRLMRLLGAKDLILTNAAGGINTSFSVGDIMLLTDHINFMGYNPLIGKNPDELGKRHFDMTRAYAPELQLLAKEVAAEIGLSLKSGVYLGCTGPSFETPAEIRAFRLLGADAVGMSTVPENIAAVHCGMRVLAFSLISNMAAGVEEKELSGDDVIEVGESRAPVLSELVKEILKRM